MKPTLGRIVIYRHSSGLDTPALVTGTRDSLAPTDPVTDSARRPSSDTHVHLAVFSWDGVSSSGVRDVAQTPPQGEIRPGTWRWPERVG